MGDGLTLSSMLLNAFVFLKTRQNTRRDGRLGGGKQNTVHRIPAPGSYFWLSRFPKKTELKHSARVCFQSYPSNYSCLLSKLIGAELFPISGTVRGPGISAAKIAQHFGISVREVHRRFSHARQGSTFLDVLRELRMTAAIRMLTDSLFSSLTIAEIGYRSGFSEPAYFGPVFRQRLGCSPGAFAKARMKNGSAERVAA